MSKIKMTEKGLCTVVANRIFLTNLSEKEILISLHDLWAKAYNEGYQQRLTEHKRFNMSREARHHKEWGKQYDKMEDMIHGGVKPIQ